MLHLLPEAPGDGGGPRLLRFVDHASGEVVERWVSWRGGVLALADDGDGHGEEGGEGA